MPAVAGSIAPSDFHRITNFQADGAGWLDGWDGALHKLGSRPDTWIGGADGDWVGDWELGVDALSGARPAGLFEPAMPASPPFGGAPGAAIPEPAALALLTLGTLSAFRRRR